MPWSEPPNGRLERGVMKQLQILTVMAVCSLAWTASSAAQNNPASVTSVRAKAAATTKNAAAPLPAAKPPAQLLFGTLPLSTHSVEARTLAEKALDNYENVQLDECIAQAKQAAEKDPQFALAYAIWSFAARRDEPATAALAKANALADNAPPEEQLLVRWMVATQSSDLLPAISLMNDMLKRFPDNKHVLYLSAEWLYFQQDYDRSRKLFEKALQSDPKFPPSLNMLGYAYIETGDPDPAKAKAALQRYAELLPDQPNPHDSLGEILRFSGDDEGSVIEYRKALKIAPTFYTSQLGVGETLTLMGKYDEARAEMDKAVAMAPTTRDKLHIEFQKVLIRFWEGKPELGRQELVALEEKARDANDGYAQYDIGLGRAFLAANTDEELTQLSRLESIFSNPFNAMAEGDRHTALASILREEVRVLAQLGKVESAQDEVQELESLARDTRDSIIEDCYESARGYALYATGDYASAADELATDPQNPLVARQIVLTQEKLGNKAQAEVDRTRWKYLRADSPQWFLAAQAPAN
jgi:tetratricopeptide (TPR) repeat protein